MGTTAPATHPRRDTRDPPAKRRATLSRDAVLGVPLRPVERMLAGLTDIERQVLNGIIRGQCEEAIASELLLGLPDVQRHRSDLMGKLRMRRTIFEKQKTAP